MPLRLFKTQAVGLEFVEWDSKRYIPYAILSHVWERGHEIEYSEIAQSSKLQHKNGWKKINECKRVALERGLQFVWIDTCCIDKISSSELTEALNSMFTWYQNAEICLVYLADVDNKPETNDKHPSRPPAQGNERITQLDAFRQWEQFRDSKWFTRGWTLQEMLAPRSLCFYNRDWKAIGTLHDAIGDDTVDYPGQRCPDVADIVSQTTGVNRDALLQTRALQSYSIAQKMSWAADRQTTRIEDMAYSLLGILDISMPVIYGEGSKAFRRLQEELLKASSDATIFAWHEQSRDSHRYVATSPSSSREYSDLLAVSPAEFKSCGTVIPLPGPKHQQLFQAIGGLIRFDTKIYQYSALSFTKHAIVLCCYEDKPTSILLLNLVQSPSKDSFFAAAGRDRIVALDIYRAESIAKAGLVNVWRNAADRSHLHAGGYDWQILVRAKRIGIFGEVHNDDDISIQSESSFWNKSLAAFHVPPQDVKFEGTVYVKTSLSADIESPGEKLTITGSWFRKSSVVPEAWPGGNISLSAEWKSEFPRSHPVNMLFILTSNTMKYHQGQVLIVRASKRLLVHRTVLLVEVELADIWRAILPLLKLSLTSPVASFVDNINSSKDLLASCIHSHGNGRSSTIWFFVPIRFTIPLVALALVRWARSGYLIIDPLEVSWTIVSMLSGWSYFLAVDVILLHTMNDFSLPTHLRSLYEAVSVFTFGRWLNIVLVMLCGDYCLHAIVYNADSFSLRPREHLMIGVMSTATTQVYQVLERRERPEDINKRYIDLLRMLTIFFHLVPLLWLGVASQTILPWAESTCRKGGVTDTAAQYYKEFAIHTGKDDVSVCLAFAYEGKLLWSIITLLMVDIAGNVLMPIWLMSALEDIDKAAYSGNGLMSACEQDHSYSAVNISMTTTAV